MTELHEVSIEDPKVVESLSALHSRGASKAQAVAELLRLGAEAFARANRPVDPAFLDEEKPLAELTAKRFAELLGITDIERARRDAKLQHEQVAKAHAFAVTMFRDMQGLHAQMVAPIRLHNVAEIDGFATECKRQLATQHGPHCSLVVMIAWVNEDGDHSPTSLGKVVN